MAGRAQVSFPLHKEVRDLAVVLERSLLGRDLCLFPVSPGNPPTLSTLVHLSPVA